MKTDRRTQRLEQLKGLVKEIKDKEDRGLTLSTRDENRKAWLEEEIKTIQEEIDRTF